MEQSQLARPQTKDKGIKICGNKLLTANVSQSLSTCGPVRGTGDQRFLWAVSRDWRGPSG